MGSEHERVAELEADLRAEQSARRVAEIKEEIVRRYQLEETRRIAKLKASVRAAEHETRRLTAERDEARTALLQARERLSRTAEETPARGHDRSRLIGELRRDTVRRGASLGRLEQQAINLAGRLADMRTQPLAAMTQLRAMRERVAHRVAALDELSDRTEEFARTLRAAAPPAGDTSP